MISIQSYIHHIIKFIKCILFYSDYIIIAVSSVGHLSYMVVRLGPVYQLGGTFLSEHNKEEWKKHSNTKKIDLLLRVPAYSWLLFEIVLLLFACCYCVFLRFTYLPILNPNNIDKCEFI